MSATRQAVWITLVNSGSPLANPIREIREIRG